MPCLTSRVQSANHLKPQKSVQWVYFLIPFQRFLLQPQPNSPSPSHSYNLSTTGSSLLQQICFLSTATSFKTMQYCNRTRNVRWHAWKMQQPSYQLHKLPAWNPMTPKTCRFRFCFENESNINRVLKTCIYRNRVKPSQKLFNFSITLSFLFMTTFRGLLYSWPMRPFCQVK